MAPALKMKAPVSWSRAVAAPFPCAGLSRSASLGAALRHDSGGSSALAQRARRNQLGPHRGRAPRWLVSACGVAAARAPPDLSHGP